MWQVRAGGARAQDAVPEHVHPRVPQGAARRRRPAPPAARRRRGVRRLLIQGRPLHAHVHRGERRNYTTSLHNLVYVMYKLLNCKV